MSFILDQVREAIATSGKTRSSIARDTGISNAQLSRLMSGQRRLSVEAVETLADYLGIEFVARPKRAGRKR